MTFMQTISFTTSRMDEMQQLMDDFADVQMSNPAENHGFIRSQVLKDRDNADAFMVVAEFETYEQAMENSRAPETDAFAKKMAELCDGPPSFGNYDKIKEESP
jgi:quinol monooxygenase YgiN